MHANDDLRESFLEAIDAFSDWKPNHPEPTIRSEGSDWSILKLCEDLIGCTDLMPDHACRDLGLPVGSNYDGGARALSAKIVAARQTLGFRFSRPA
jgi:hypothetical protein